MDALRLAIVTPRFWPHVGDVSGHLMQLAESWIDLGHHPRIVTPQWKRSWPEQMTIGRVPLVRLRGSPRGGWSTLRWMYSLGTWLRDAANPIDAVLVAGIKHEAHVALGAARRTKTPTILMADEDDLTWQKTVTLGARIATRCREAKAVVTPTNEMAEALARSGFSRECLTNIPRTTSIPPPQSPKSRDDARAALAAANYDLVTTANTQVALAMGRLEPSNRFGDLVRAWRIVTARKPEARLWIVGDGPERERLYHQISDLDQRFRALLPGTFDGPDDLFQASDMLVVPEPHAAPPIALLQAQAAGLPVVATDSPSLRSHIEHGRTGLLYPPGDFKALAAAVLQLMENPAECVKSGAAARAAMQSAQTPIQEAQQYIELIQRMTAH
jgi:glycosyltransferase involved in cell wall biosynthesis